MPAHKAGGDGNLCSHVQIQPEGLLLLLCGLFTFVPLLLEAGAALAPSLLVDPSLGAEPLALLPPLSAPDPLLFLSCPL